MPASPVPEKRSTPYLFAVAAAYAGGVIGYLPLLVFLLPIKVERLSGDARIGVLTLVVVAGALTASVANIAFGALSDRAAARGHGRRSGLIAAVIALGAAYVLLAAVSSATGIVIGVVLFQLAINAVLAPLLAIVADEVPDAQKGLVGGLFSLANPLASALSSVLLGVALLGENARLLTVPVVVAACVAPLLLSRSTLAAAQASAAPAPPRDLAIAWGARLLVQVAGNALSLYVLYYFESIDPGASRPALASAVGQLLTLAYLAPLPVAVLVGRWSDLSGRRKPFLLGAAGVAALGLLLMAAARAWPMGAAGFVTYAIGSAVFLGLHAGFAMQLLPSPAHRGRDLGILNLANTLPALGGPLLTWWLATPHDFHAVMLWLAALTSAGGIVILAARGRR